MKSFRVNHVPWCAPEGLAALVRARSLESAVRKVKEGRDLRLPDGTYYIFEEGRYARSLQITLSPKNVILKNGGK